MDPVEVKSNKVFSGIRILTYHTIIAEKQKELPPQWSPFHAVALPAFREQLDVLASQDWQVVPLHALEQPSTPRRSVVITFDDGGCSDLLAAQELQRRSMPAAFFVTWSRLGSSSFLNRSQVAELGRQGFTIGSHGMTHARFSDLSAQGLRDQLVGSRERLEGLVGQPVTALALPFGAYNGAVVAAALAAGYRRILTSDFALADSGKCVLPRLTISAQTTLEDFRALLGQNRIGIARRRVINGIHRRFNRIRSITAGAL
jgi:peptidoglycan/xylan/chitin deacetylase (PgdA/CDA1 family)